MPKGAADPPKENPRKPAKVMTPEDQLQDLGAAEGEDKEEEQEQELPDLSLAFFQKLKDTLENFADGPITIAALQDIAEQSI